MICGYVCCSCFSLRYVGLWFIHHSSIWIASISMWHLETGVVQVMFDPLSVNINSMSFLVLVMKTFCMFFRRFPFSVWHFLIWEEGRGRGKVNLPYKNLPTLGNFYNSLVQCLTLPLSWIIWHLMETSFWWVITTDCLPFQGEWWPC
jgi:hypothetical protein